MSEGIAIRRARLTDYPALQALFRELDGLHGQCVPWLFRASDGEPRPRAHLEGLLAAPDAAVFVAGDAECVGLGSVTLRDSPDLPMFVRQRYAVVDDFVVRSDRRRQGIGRRLYEACERWAFERGAQYVELGVYEFNEDARRFYASLGFETHMRKLHRRR